jgi:hypothetical protein
LGKRKGLVAQYVEPGVTIMLGDPAESTVVFGSIGLGLLCQVAVTLLLIRTDVMT